MPSLCSVENQMANDSSDIRERAAGSTLRHARTRIGRQPTKLADRPRSLFGPRGYPDNQNDGVPSFNLSPFEVESY
jgi:hypothetical protein